MSSFPTRPDPLIKVQNPRGDGFTRGFYSFRIHHKKCPKCPTQLSTAKRMPPKQILPVKNQPSILSVGVTSEVFPLPVDEKAFPHTKDFVKKCSEALKSWCDSAPSRPFSPITDSSCRDICSIVSALSMVGSCAKSSSSFIYFSYGST